MAKISHQQRITTISSSSIGLIAFILNFLLVCFPATATPITFKEIKLDQDTEINISIYNAGGQYRILWISAFATPANTIENIANQLSAYNTEVWHADFLDARFLPKTASSVYKIAEKDIITVINTAVGETSKKLFIYTESRAVIPVLLALRQIQQSASPMNNFGGVIMTSPYFYMETPDPGTDAQLMPVVSATNLPVFILQPKNSPRYWQLQQTVPALENSGSDVFIQVLPGIRGRFLFRPDSTPLENALTTNFGQYLFQAIKYLETVRPKNRKPDLNRITPVPNSGTKKDRFLQAYKGNPQPPALSLPDLAGNNINLKNLNQRVVLVNFWASWCPPCVEEMPSLQRLSKHLPEEEFLILGVNIAESKQVIENFLSEKIKIDFPILLDSDGSTMRQWNVMAFPTSFVIDKRGKIRYALFGSIDWDTQEIKNRIKTLLEE